jgi:ribA/ribD-fused uncharacterized protein
VIKTIDHFRGEYFFLSNFYPIKVVFDEVPYPSAEHAYVAAKTTDETMRRVIARIETAAEVKKYGRKIKIRDNWRGARWGLMYTIVLSKFSKSKELQQMLIDTGDATLIEGNTWGDTYWGICDGRGENHLGKILMKVREELRG